MASELGAVRRGAGCQVRLAMVQNQWHHFGVGAPPILEPIFPGFESLVPGWRLIKQVEVSDPR